MSEISLIRLAEAYAEHSRVGLARVGFLAAGDGKFFGRLQSGKTCTIRLYRRVLQWFSDNWPAHLEWPPDVPRPAPASEAKEAA